VGGGATRRAVYRNKGVDGSLGRGPPTFPSGVKKGRIHNHEFCELLVAGEPVFQVEKGELAAVMLSCQLDANRRSVELK
jgi:hypothetical protein